MSHTIRQLVSRADALRELRRDRAPLVWMSAVIPLGYLEMMLAVVPGPRGIWLVVAVNPVKIVLATIGLWLGHNWARVLAGCVSAGFSLLHVWGAVQHLASDRDPRTVVEAIGVLMVFGGGGAVLAWLAFQPATREQFERTRR